MDNWLVRFDDEGKSYNGFQWEPIGEWTVAPDWNPAPVCGGGLHGQGPGGWGHCEPGRAFNLCEYDPDAGVVVVDGNKLKVQRARRIAIDTEAWERVIDLTHGQFPGSLNLQLYRHPLPTGLITVGGSLSLISYPYPLPSSLITVKGSLLVRDYLHRLPKRLTTVGGYLYLRGYSYPLLEGLGTPPYTTD